MSVGLRIATDNFTKTPDEVNTFTLDYSPHLGDLETLLSVDSQSVTSDGAVGTDVVVDSTSINPATIAVTVSLGVDGGVYFVKTRMLTNLGQKIDGVVRIVVQNASEA